MNDSFDFDEWIKRALRRLRTFELWFFYMAVGFAFGFGATLTVITGKSNPFVEAMMLVVLIIFSIAGIVSLWVSFKFKYEIRTMKQLYEDYLQSTR